MLQTQFSGMSAAAEKVAGNIDMLYEILIRVPSKSLLRLKCVSKQWKTLISDQQFLDSHSLHHQQHQLYPNSLIFTYEDQSLIPFHHILSLSTTTTTTPRVLNFDFLNQTELVIVRSCNGLLLCRPSNNTSTYFICNPITQDFTTHPCRDEKYKLELYGRNRRSLELYLAFEPSSISPYKVVSVAALNPPHDWLFHVYTLFKTHCHSTTASGVFAYSPFALDIADGVYCNGAIHWCKLGGQDSVYFDIYTQCLKKYPMPPVSECFRKCLELPFSRSYYFGESGGRLHLMFPSSNRDLLPIQLAHSHLIDIFELKEDYSGWSLMHCLDLESVQVEFPQMTWQAAVLNFCIVRTPKEKKKSSLLMLIVGMEGVICYDCVDKTSTKLCDFVLDLLCYPICVSLGIGHVLQHFEHLC